VGSCSYSDFCRDIVQNVCDINTSNCPPELAQFGIDCNCPFDIPAQIVDELFELDILDMYYVEGIGEIHHLCPFFFHGFGVTQGDFDVKVIVTDDSNQHVACFRFLYTVTRA
jgi:hypothetical protein